MDNLRNAIEILFLKQDPCAVLSGHSAWSSMVNGVDKEQFKESFLAEHGPYSGNQAAQLYDLMSRNWMAKGSTVSIFNLLSIFGRRVLRIQNGKPVCQYEHYLRWHELTSSIGEDILTCAYLAQEELYSQDTRKSFAWKLVLESDNTQLDTLFRRKLSELHCHLNGSSLNFDANWMAIMNEPKYQQKKWFGKNGNADDSKLYEYALLAAYIRMYLFLSLNQVLASRKFIRTFEKVWCAKDKLSLLDFYLSDLQTEISVQSTLRGHRYDGRVVDYAAPYRFSKADEASALTQFIVGERRLMYQCFQQVYSGRLSVAGLPLMFYLYLIVKSKVKGQLVQNNGIKGFENFKQYDVNKEKFVENARNCAYQELIPRAAVQSFSKNSHIDYFEFRIAPKDTASSMRDKLNHLDKWFVDSEPHCVLHFIKQPDRESCFRNDFSNSWICRNSEGRKTYAGITSAIEMLLRKNDKRIVGIDAANSEFGCRPEVFGQVYRRLQHFQRDTSMDLLVDNTRKDLGFTYHVGEDYFDVVDGLRAIEEAITFLNLKDGSRLGHAVALGIDVPKYYRERKNTIIIPKQDLLDNCVWLLSKMDAYGIEDKTGIRSKLIAEYQRLTNELYPAFHLEDYRVYYQSWLLRGDNPYLYQEGKKPVDTVSEPYALNHFNHSIDLARDNKRVRELYQAYHFSPYAKYSGHQPEEVKLPVTLIAIVEAVQKEMRNAVARKKISIEVNPTSNLRICNIDTYDTHPVLKFRNYGLSIMDETNDCPQISVSINTDDQGIFATSIEKEFTLMSLAVEKMKDEEGKAKYQPNNILAWLENIREQSISQRFA